MSKKLWLAALVIVLALASVRLWHRYESRPTAQENEEAEVAVVSPVPASSQEIAALPTEHSALGGYNVLIADRGNNRLIEVTPDKNIVWEYDFHLPAKGLGADDAFFTDGGRSIIAGLEEYHVIQQIDYASKQVTWQYGEPGHPGSKDGMLNTPDDPYKLPNGDVTVADIKNCRVLEIAPDKHIVRQYGQVGHCSKTDGLLSKPNGDTPVSDGHTLISNIGGSWLLELDQDWKAVFSMKLPVKYPSDPQMTKAGNILVSDYSTPGQIVEVSKSGQVVWQYGGEGTTLLNKPSLAIELPNGNILANDDLNHRVIVIDKQTKKIVWQYGVTGKAGAGPGQLNVPDGVDIIMHAMPQPDLAPSPSAAPAPISVGYLMKHRQSLVGVETAIEGYMIKKDTGYIIFSDEKIDTPNPNDLPVNGSGEERIMPRQKYILTGRLVYKGLAASNGNPYHFELTKKPVQEN
jgi:hypothetical protein